jgi:hypothetical protein
LKPLLPIRRPADGHDGSEGNPKMWEALRRSSLASCRSAPRCFAFAPADAIDAALNRDSRLLIP